MTTNGWSAYEKLVPDRLDRLDGANVSTIDKLDHLEDYVVRIDAKLSGVYYKAAVIAGAVSLAISFGVKPIVELLLRVIL